MAKTAILSTFPIPNKKVGSWVRRVEYYLQQHQHQVDFLICPKRDTESEKANIGVQQIDVNVKSNRLFEKLDDNYRHKEYGQAVTDLVNKHGSLVLLIMDNYKVLFAVQAALVRQKLRQKVRIIFNICGHSYFFDPKQGMQFYSSIDEMIFLTESAYRFELNRYHTIPCEVSVLPNPINPDRFSVPNQAEKTALRKKHQLKDETIFLWLSRDRPKKGLGVILKAWEQFYPTHQQCKLLVIGNKDNRTKQEGVIFKGLLPHDQLADYLKLSDFFLFSTLCYEGYPLSLLEALSCGLTPIASALGSVIEILGDGKYGHLIDFPHAPNHWAKSFQHVLEADNTEIQPWDNGQASFTIEHWSEQIDQYFSKWKRELVNGN